MQKVFPFFKFFFFQKGVLNNYGDEASTFQQGYRQELSGGCSLPWANHRLDPYAVSRRRILEHRWRDVEFVLEGIFVWWGFDRCGHRVHDNCKLLVQGHGSILNSYTILLKTNRNCISLPTQKQNNNDFHNDRIWLTCRSTQRVTSTRNGSLTILKTFVRGQMPIVSSSKP